MDRLDIILESRNKILTEVYRKRVLFITTKNLDYIRNVQEIALIKKSAEKLDIIGFKDKKYVTRLAKIYLKLLLIDVKNYDEIFVGFAPQLILPFIELKFRKKRVVIDFFISLYDTFVNDRQKIKRDSKLASILKFVDQKTMEKASLVISDTKTHGNYFIEEFGVEPKKVHTLYLEADKKIYYPQKIAKEKKVKDRFVVLYFGSILPLQGIDIVLGAFDLLKNDRRFYFYMIGTIGDKFLKPQAENIEYIDWVPQEKLASYIAMADLCLAGHFNSQIGKAKRTIPGKAYIYDAMDKTIILGDCESNHEIFSECDEHIYFVEMGNSQALMNKIVEIMYIQQKSKNGRCNEGLFEDE